MTSLLLAGAAVGVASSLFLIHVGNTVFNSEVAALEAGASSVVASAGVFIGLASVCLFVMAVAEGVRGIFSGENLMYAQFLAEDYASRDPQQKALLNKVRQEFGPETALWP